MYGSSPAAHRFILLFVILILALNLRPAIAAIGPLLDLIQQSTQLNSVWSGALTMIPVCMMGVIALVAGPLRQRLGALRGVSLGALCILLACIGRLPFSSGGALVASAVLAGTGIALVQAFMPGIIKQRFAAKAGQVMGLYTTGIMAGAAVAASSVAWLAGLSSWSIALAVWALPALLAIVLWERVRRAELVVETPGLKRTAVPFQRNARAWLLLVFFGVGTGAYTLVLAWLPPFYVELGESRNLAGLLLGALTLTEVLAGLLISAVIDRCPDRRPLLLGALLSLLTGLGCLLLAPLTLMIPAVVLLGLGIGALFPLSLIISLDQLDDPAEAGDLLAFVQGGGYIIASLMPLLAGWVRDQASGLEQAWLIMAIGTLLMMAMSLRFSPNSQAERNGLSSTVR